MSEQNGQIIINELSNAKNDVMELLDFINHLEKQSDIDVLKPEEKIILREVLAEYGNSYYGTEMELTIDNVKKLKDELNETLNILNDGPKIESMVADDKNANVVKEIEAELLKEVAIDSEEEISRYCEKSEDVAATEEKIQEVKAKRKLDSSASNREQNVNNDVIKHYTENIDEGGSNFRVVATENNNPTVNNNLSQALYDNNARNDTEKESWRRKLWRNIKKPLKSNPLNACFGRCMGRK